jgi:hypothetical protein
VAKDQVVSFTDVNAPADGLVERLWQEQNERWPLVSEAVDERLTQPSPAGAD